MQDDRLGFFARLWLAIWLPWVLLFNGRKALRARLAVGGEAVPALPAAPEAELEPALRAPAEVPEPVGEEAATGGGAEVVHLVPPEPEPEPEAPEDTAALHLLGILQREGRLVDFLEEDLSGATDAQVGAAARLVHDGCRKALHQYVRLEPVRAEPEDASITVPDGFDAAQIRLTGNVVGHPPFQGRLAHHGWRAASISLPTLAEGQDPAIIAPAEVEL